MGRLLRSLCVVVLGSLLLGNPTAAAICNTTLTEGYIYGFSCNSRGWVQVPSVIRTVRSSTVAECATRCLKEKACRSHRFIKCKEPVLGEPLAPLRTVVIDADDLANKQCTLYSKGLEQMYMDPFNRQPGILNDRNCYSNNCNIIDACDMVKKCTVVENDHFFPFATYQKFACSYGRKMRLYGLDPASISVRYFSPKLSACEALQKCAFGGGRETRLHRGLRDVHFHKPSNRWVCISSGNGDCSYYYYYDVDQEFYVNPFRYTEVDSKIGAGFGYYLGSLFCD